jgi:hypothetical protein
MWSAKSLPDRGRPGPGAGARSDRSADAGELLPGGHVEDALDADAAAQRDAGATSSWFANATDAGGAGAGGMIA